MKRTILLALATSATLLVGCTEETKSIQWYMDNPDDTYVVYSKCLKSGNGNKNCENAARGAKSLSFSNDPEVKKRFQEFFPPKPIPQFK